MKILEPTRITKSSSSCIDNIFTSNNLGVAISIDAGLSDHSVQLLNYEYQENCTKQVKYVMKRSFSAKQIDHFSQLLKVASWDSLYQKEDVNNMFNEFMNIFNTLFNKAFPLLRKQINKPKDKINKWYTPELEHLAVEVMRLYSISKSTISTLNDQNTYLCELNKYKLQIEENKQSENEKTIKQSNNKSRTAWDLIQQNINKTASYKHEITLSHNNKQINCAKEVSNLFNIFFNEAATNALKIIKDPSNVIEHKRVFTQKSNNTFFLSPLSAKEFLDIIDKVTTKKSAGFDDVPCHILKHVAIFLANPLIFIINESFSTGIFPER
jgi:hypothetical protein